MSLQTHQVAGPAGSSITPVREVSGTCYHADTCPPVVRVLEQSFRSGQRVRLFYGDTLTGRSWLDEWGVIGTVKRSMGPIKVPILLPTVRSRGGPAILDHCIVRIQAGRMVRYTHPDFHIGTTSIRRGDTEEWPWELWIDDRIHARFKTRERADRLVDFLIGQRNGK